MAFMNEMVYFHSFFLLVLSFNTIHYFTLYKKLLKLGCVDTSLLNFLLLLCIFFPLILLSFGSPPKGDIWAFPLYLSSCLSPELSQPHSLSHHVSRENSLLHLLIVFMYSPRALNIQKSKSSILKCVLFLLPEKMKHSLGYTNQKCDY